MTKIRIEHNGVVAEITQDAAVLDDVLDICRRAINGVGFYCGELEEKFQHKEEAE